MKKKNKALEIYLTYCRKFIETPEGLYDWSKEIKNVFIAKQFLFVVLGNQLCKYKLIQGIHEVPLLQFVQKTSQPAYF